MDSRLPSLQYLWSQSRCIPAGVWIVIIAYSLVAFGSPMPPKITWLEITMGFGLVLGGLMLSKPLLNQLWPSALPKWAASFALILLFMPLCIGLLRGNALVDIARDVFPLMFLLVIPFLLIYSSPISECYRLRIIVTSVLLFVGLITATMFFVGAISLYGSIDELVAGSTKYAQSLEGVMPSHIASAQVDSAAAPSEATKVAESELRQLFLKPYDPAMLFAAIFLGGWGVVWMIKSWGSWVLGILLMSLGGGIAYGFMALGLRAYTVFFVLAVVLICLTQWRARGLYLRVLPVILVACILLWPKIEMIIQLLLAKQLAVGSNGKLNEWRAVFETICASPQTFMFGIGWGGLFENPIYGSTTRFTHSVLAFYLLKSGVLGFALFVSTLGLLFVRQENIHSKPSMDISAIILLASCIFPLLIGVLLQPTYKMISFGMIFTLLVLALTSESEVK